MNRQKEAPFLRVQQRNGAFWRPKGLSSSAAATAGETASAEAAAAETAAGEASAAETASAEAATAARGRRAAGTARSSGPSGAGAAAEEKAGVIGPAIVPPAAQGAGEGEHQQQDYEYERDNGSEARPVVIVGVVVRVLIVVSALRGTRASVERGGVVERGEDVHKVREQRSNGLVILSRVRIGPEIAVHERVDAVSRDLVGNSGSDGEPAAVLLDNVQQEHAVVCAGAAYAPGVEQQVRILLRVVARRQVVYGDDDYLRPVAVFFKRAACV